jgi:hypothetical protein
LPYVVREAQVSSNTADGGPGSDPSSTGGRARGGGVYFADGGTLYLERSALVGNVAQAGPDPAASAPAVSLGGGLASLFEVVMTNTTVALNRADQGGGLGGISNNWSLFHDTIYSNSATLSGGGLGGQSPVVDLRNSLVAFNAGGNCDAVVNPGGANLQYPDATCTGVTVADPRLVPLADNGGATLTAALKPGSPALDAGNPTDCPATDQRGYRRPVGAGCDLGAYERWLDLFLPLARR